MIDPDRIYHVYPVSDLREHEFEMVYPVIGDPYCECECKPKYDYEEGCNFVVIHNSFDKREVKEELIKKAINNTSLN